MGSLTREQRRVIMQNASDCLDGRKGDLGLRVPATGSVQLGFLEGSGAGMSTDSRKCAVRGSTTLILKDHPAGRSFGGSVGKALAKPE